MFDRREFFRRAAGIVGGVALEAAIPFNRVWSFPTKVRLYPRPVFRIRTPYDIVAASVNGVRALRGIDFEVVPTSEHVITIEPVKGFEVWQHVEIHATRQSDKYVVGASMLQPAGMTSKYATDTYRIIEGCEPAAG